MKAHVNIFAHTERLYINGTLYHRYEDFETLHVQWTEYIVPGAARKIDYPANVGIEAIYQEHKNSSK